MTLTRAVTLLLALAVLLMVTAGCQSAPTATDAPQYTASAVIRVVQVYGVPYLAHYAKEGRILLRYEGSPTAGQEWAAAYEGRGRWRIQGTVILSHDGQDRRCSSTWTYNEATNKLAITYFRGN